MKNKVIHECPVCGGNLRVRVLYCPTCHIRIEGDFEPQKSRLNALSRKELEFIELFVRVRGNIKEVEKALGVSYPTVRGMLDSTIKNMGYPVKQPFIAKKRMEIIEQLDKGKISAEKAAEMLKTGLDDEEMDKSEGGGE